MKRHFSDEWLKEKIENDPDVPCEAGRIPSGTFDYFVTSVPRLPIGQRVRVVNPMHAADWPEPVIVTGIAFNAVRGAWNISIMPMEDIEAGYGSTDGWTEDDLRPA